MTQKQQTELSVIERAALAMGSGLPEKQLIAMAQESKAIVAITNKDGYQEAQAARMKLRKARTSIATIGKAARDDATKFSKAVIAEEDRLIAIIKPEEERLDKLQTEWDEKIEAEKQAKIEAERKAQEELMNRVQAIEHGLNFGDGSARIEERIKEVEAIVIDESFGEFLTIAHNRKEESLKALYAALEGARTAENAAAEAEVAKQQQEAEKARLEAEQAEIARQRAELDKQREAIEAEKQRIADEQAAAERQRQEAERQRVAEEEAKRQAELKAEADRLAAERAAIEAEKARQQAEQEAKERAERERIASEEKARADAAKAPDREKLQAYANALCAVPMPELSTDSAKLTAEGITNALDLLCKRIYTAAENL